MADIMKRASFKTKDVSKLPQGAKVIKKETSVEVEEIENGYLIVKRSEIKYELNKMNDWLYSTSKYFSKDNPFKVDSKSEDKSLAEIFS